MAVHDDEPCMLKLNSRILSQICGARRTGDEVWLPGQFVHELAPALENVFAGQVLQLVASGPLYVPAAHVLQDLLSR